MSVILSFKKRTGQLSRSPEFLITDAAEKAAITALFNEAEDAGRTLEVVSSTTDNTDDQDVNSMTIGIGADSDIEGISADYYNPNFFVAGRDYYGFSIVNNGSTTIELNAGTTEDGTEVFSGQTVGAGLRALVSITVSPTVNTPLYLWSSSWGSNDVDIKTHSDPA